MYGTILEIKFADRLKSGLSTASADIWGSTCTLRYSLEPVWGWTGCRIEVASLTVLWRLYPLLRGRAALTDGMGFPLSKHPGTWHGPAYSQANTNPCHCLVHKIRFIGTLDSQCTVVQEGYPTALLFIVANLWLPIQNSCQIKSTLPDELWMRASCHDL